MVCGCAGHDREYRRIFWKGNNVIGILIAVLLAALVYALCVALGLPSIVAIIAAILVLLAGIPTGGYGIGSRFGSGRRGA